MTPEIFDVGFRYVKFFKTSPEVVKEGRISFLIQKILLRPIAGVFFFESEF